MALALLTRPYLLSNNPGTAAALGLTLALTSIRLVGGMGVREGCDGGGEGRREVRIGEGGTDVVM